MSLEVIAVLTDDFDLDNDGFETANLLPNLTVPQQAAHDALVAELVALGVD